ncbi:MAG: hypothetical protein R3F24_05385 [Gammaproteobacteria bacterium]
MHRSRRLRLALATAVLFSTTSPTYAATVSLCGPMVCYEYDDDVGNNPGLTAFGSPSLLAGSDVLEFTPTSFGLISTGGTTESTTATFQFSKVYATNGGEITS